MKSLFVYLPLCYPVSPYFALPLLSSALQNKGYDSACLDLNVQFWNEKIFNEKFLSDRFFILKKNIEDIKANKYKYSNEFEKEYINHRIKSSEVFVKEYEKSIDTITSSLEEAKKTFKSKSDFYKPEKIYKAIKIFRCAQNILLYSFFLSKNLKRTMSNNTYTLNHFVTNKNINPFYDYLYEKVVKKKEFDKYDYIFISQPFELQTLAIYTFCYLLKKYSKVKICLGGNYASRIADKVKENKSFWGKYFDYYLEGIGEEAIIKFADFIECGEPINTVPGLIYKENDEIKYNKPAYKLSDINNRIKVDFKGIKFSDYFIPEIVLPIQVSKGCSWGKCSFCVFHEGKPCYQIASPKIIAQEFEYYYKKYGITKFEFADESLSPQFYNEIAKEIIKSGIKISYYGFARFDSGFTKEIMQNMKESGFKIFEWGYESPCKRVMKIFNKGIDIDNRLDLLKLSDEVNLWNHCLTITDVPFETIEEELEDYKVYEQNKHLFHSRLITSFILFKKSKIAENIEKYNIKEVKDEGNLSITLSYKRKDFDEYSKHIKDLNKQREALYKHYGQYIWVPLVSVADEYLFLYVDKYGKNDCINMKIKNNL